MIQSTTPLSKTIVVQAAGKYRWVVVALLFFATSINYPDRKVIDLIKDNLAKEFNSSEKDYSSILMTFSSAYALGLLLFGTLRSCFRAGVVLHTLLSTLHEACSFVLFCFSKNIYNV